MEDRRRHTRATRRVASALLRGAIATAVAALIGVGPTDGSVAATTETTTPTIETTPSTNEQGGALTVPLVRVQTGCDAPDLPYVVFLGTVMQSDKRTTQFKIVQVRAGRVEPFADDDAIYIRYGQDTQYLHVGATYLVGAAKHPALGILVSRVTPPVEDFGGDQVIGKSDTDVTCDKVEDPAKTVYPDGSDIETPMLRPIRDAWFSVLTSIAFPIAVAIGVVFALALLRTGSKAAIRLVTPRDHSHG